jgi:uncharacterized damage-inducible protein DinB
VANQTKTTAKAPRAQSVPEKFRRVLCVFAVNGCLSQQVLAMPTAVTRTPEKGSIVMTPAYFQELYDYTYWNNRRFWACLLQLSDEQVMQPVDESDWSLFVHCLHIIGVEEWWIRFLATGEIQFLAWDKFADRAALRAQWDVTEPMVRAYVAALTREELERKVRPPFWEAGQGPITVAQALTQVAFHSADHRAQALTHIRRLGGPTVEQDFLGYLVAKQPG